MLENRSFDNTLGWLYDPANDAPYNVVPASRQNRRPAQPAAESG